MWPRRAVGAAGHVVRRLLSFWMLWHAYGGDRDRLLASSVTSQSVMYVNLREFREVFGVEVSDFLPATGAALAGSREAKAASGAA
jgi:hypothetical protein